MRALLVKPTKFSSQQVGGTFDARDPSTPAASGVRIAFGCFVKGMVVSHRWGGTGPRWHRRILRGADWQKWDGATAPLVHAADDHGRRLLQRRVRDRPRAAQRRCR